MKTLPARFLGLLLLFGLAVVGVVACDDDDPLGSGDDVAQVIINFLDDSLLVGDSLQLQVIVIDQEGDTLSNQTVSFASSNTAVASVSATGLVRALTAGTATISATVDGESDSVDFTVTTQQVASNVSITPGDSTFAIGDSVGFTATVTTANGDTIVGAPVTFTSSDTTVATVSSTGRVTGRAAGTATITATSGTISDTVVVTIGTPGSANVGTVVLTPDSLTLAVGGSDTLAVAVTDSLGAAVTNPLVVFTSTSEANATVNSRGIVNAIATGVANIIGTFGTKADTTAVTVN